MSDIPSTMRAAVLAEPGARLTIEEIPTPQPLAGEVLLRVEACGVCHTDLHVMNGDVAFPTPAVLGHELAGVIVALGEGVDTFSIGDSVVTSFIMPCGKCRRCTSGREDLCEPFFEMNRLRGTLFDGTSRLRREDGSTLAMYSMAGLAEYAVTPVTGVFARGDGLHPEEAAVLGCAVFTAFGAVRHRGVVAPGENVAVIGAGGVGSAIIQLSRAFGASRVIAIDLQDEKLELARVNGATHTVNAATDDPVESVRSLTDGGADVVFEAIGLAATWSQGLEMVDDGGRFVAVGIGGRGATADVEITRTVRRAISILGSYGGRVSADMPEVIRLAAAGEIDPGKMVTRRFALDDAAAAYETLERGEITGRAVIVP
jgi:S-(hydroxymethyl)glutathione dehydrogenase/alcohol dehydrogenase